jgi:hypothetical protein
VISGCAMVGVTDSGLFEMFQEWEYRFRFLRMKHVKKVSRFVSTDFDSRGVRREKLFVEERVSL